MATYAITGRRAAIVAAFRERLRARDRRGAAR
jgi:hypothetical protein